MSVFKRMLCCPGNGQELLSALDVTLVCHASNVFFFQVIDAFSKSVACVVGQA